MKLISALLQESTSGLFTNSIKEFGNDEFEDFAIGYKMLGGVIVSGDDFVQGIRRDATVPNSIPNPQTGQRQIVTMIDFKFTLSDISPDYGHFAFDNASLADLVKTKFMDKDIRRKIGKEFNISPVAKDFELQIFVAVQNDAVRIVSSLGRHKRVN